MPTPLAPPSRTAEEAGEPQRRTNRLQRTLADLQASETRFRDLLSAVFDGFVIHQDGCILEASPGFARLFDYQPAELVGRSVLDLAPAESRNVMLRNFADSLPQRYEAICLTRDGQPLDVELLDSACCFHGQPARALAVRDISRRRRGEALRVRMAAIMRSSSEAIVGTSVDGTVTDWNGGAERLYGYSAQEMVGHSIGRIIPPECLHELPDIQARVKAGERMQDLETRRMRRDGTRVDVSISTSPVLDGLGCTVGAATVAHDITLRKTAEKQAQTLAQAEKLRALGQMASGIAHDLNQSLMLVASYSDLAKRALDREPPDLEELYELFSTATQAALDGGESVKRLLLFTRQAPESEGKPVELSSLVRDVAQMTAPRWRDTPQVEGRPISLQVEASGNPSILGSAPKLREALTNLVFNSVDALPRGGTIRLSVGVEGNRAVVRVIDTGVGMLPEVQARVFEPFYTTKGGSGTGLGLSMVFGIVEQHGGSVQVTSTLGAGTTFLLAFPLLASAPVCASTPHPATPKRTIGPLRVLAVDDEPAMTRAVVRMLRPAGHTVSVAASAEEALERLATEPMDVVISDMGMGAGMNGWDLAAAVKLRWPHMRFLLATGWGAAIDPIEANARGVEAVLAKPYRPVDLEAALAGAPPCDSAA